MINYLKLIRISNIKKNTVIFFPYIFSGTILKPEFNDIFILSITAVIFTLTTSLFYIINDIFDLEKDIKHPVKQNRPIASGQIQIKHALIFAALISILILFSLLFFDFIYEFKIYIFLYILNNLAYNLFLKKWGVFIGSLSISIGFLLRLYLGSAVMYIQVKSWLVLFVFFSTFFLSILKKLSDDIQSPEEEISKKIKLVTNSLIIIMTGLYLTHIYLYLNGANFLLVTINVFIYFQILLLVQRYFKHSTGPKDPVEIFKVNKNSIYFLIWLISYLYLRYFSL